MMVKINRNIELIHPRDAELGKLHLSEGDTVVMKVPGSIEIGIAWLYIHDTGMVVSDVAPTGMLMKFNGTVTIG